MMKTTTPNRRVVDEEKGAGNEKLKNIFSSTIKEKARESRRVWG